MSHVFTGAACSSNKGFAAVIAVLNFFSDFSQVML